MIFFFMFIFMLFNYFFSCSRQTLNTTFSLSQNYSRRVGLLMNIHFLLVSYRRVAKGRGLTSGWGWGLGPGVSGMEGGRKGVLLSWC